MKNPVMHGIVVREHVAYLGGVTAHDGGLDTAGQMQQIVSQLDDLLSQAGSDKTRMISALIFLADFEGKSDMNTVWLDWVGESDLPTRATIGVNDLGSGILIEVVVTAECD